MYIVYSIGFLSHLTDLYHKVPVYRPVKFFSLSFLYFLFLFKYEQRSGRQRNTMGIRKYKFRCYFKQAPPSLSTIFGSKLPHFVHTRKKKKERKKKRDKTLHLFVSSPSTFHRPPIIHLSFEILKRLLSSFFSRGRFSFGISD